jgi:hypothetical protein
MHKALLTLALLASAVAANAENYLHVHTDSGWEVINLDLVDRLTFTNGNMVATDAAQNVIATIPQSSLQNMYVNESAGISKPTVDSSATATFTFNATSKMATLLADGAFDVYNEAGKRILAIPHAQRGETVNLSALSAGTIIIKSGNYSLKTIVK